MKTTERMFNDVIVQRKIHWFTSLKTSLYVHYTKNGNVRWLHDIQSLFNTATKCNCTISSVFQNKVSPYRIYFSSGLHCKSKFRQNRSHSLCTLTLCDFKKKIFATLKTKEFTSLKIAHSKLQNSLGVCCMFTFRLYQKIIIS